MALSPGKEAGGKVNVSYDPGRPVIKGNENTIQAGQERLSAGGLMARPVGFEPTTYGLEERRVLFNAL